MSLTFDRWRRLMASLELGPSEPTFEALAAAYAEPQRHYHNQTHIADCLALLDEVRSAAAQPAEVELALWFHDAVYNTRAFDNETRSADWAVTVLKEAGAEDAVAARVAGHIRATEHDADPPLGDAALVVDIDLSILGRPPAAFDAFDQAIRKEYAWVPGFLYRRTRRQILEGLLDRPVLYTTPALRARFEARARANLERALGRLAA